MLIAIVAFVAAVAGVWAGRELFPSPPSPGVELHSLLHDGLELDEAQQTKLQMLESHLELELRADNARLAAAIEAEHGNGPQVAAAVDRSHGAMGELQKETLNHMFAMRQILRPDQARTFDRAVVKALTADAR